MKKFGAPSRLAASAALTAGAVILSGCTAAPSETPASTPPYVGHIHGLGADPATGQTYAATHTGVWLLPTDDLPATYPARDRSGLEAPVQLAGRWQDTMGFTVAGPGLLLASGHPDPEEQPELAPPNLGLISSTDGALTWDTLSLRGEVDLHDLEAVRLPNGQLRIYGFDSGAGTVLISNDGGARWSTGADVSMRDLAADPALPDRVFATTAEGLLVSNDGASSFEPVQGAPFLSLLTFAGTTGEMIGIDTGGLVWVSSDAVRWESRAQVAGVPEALSYVGGKAPWLLIADERGVLATDDYGITTTALVQYGDTE
ncbi:F510_1955 family glycosylhydrolase [Agromyces bauzanensis]